MISCHEAGHAIAAYHLRLPFYRVRFTEPRTLNWGTNRIEPDNDAIAVTWTFLHYAGATAEKVSISYGAVLMMGRAVNIHINGADLAEAEEGAGKDREQLDCFFNEDMKYNPQQQEYLRERIKVEVERIRNLIGFRESLDAVAAALIAQHCLSMDNVTAVIEGAVGQKMANPRPIPTHADVELGAFYRSTSRPADRGDAIEDWVAAEKGLRFGFALV
jgi:hypothetical protein